MIILLEVLRRIRKRINFVYLLLIGISILVILLSIIGAATDNINRIDETNNMSDIVFSTLGILALIITTAILIKDGLRYIFLSYYHLEKTLLIKTQYYPEFFIISLITPLANLIYPYKYLNDLIKEYSCETNHKKNIYLILLMLLYNILFVLNIVLGILNVLKRINIPSINVIYYFELLIVVLFGGLSVKYINYLFNIQKTKLEKYYSIVKSEET